MMKKQVSNLKGLFDGTVEGFSEHFNQLAKGKKVGIDDYYKTVYGL